MAKQRSISDLTPHVRDTTEGGKTQELIIAVINMATSNQQLIAGLSKTLDRSGVTKKYKAYIDLDQELATMPRFYKELHKKVSNSLKKLVDACSNADTHIIEVDKECAENYSLQSTTKAAAKTFGSVAVKALSSATGGAFPFSTINKLTTSFKSFQSKADVETIATLFRSMQNDLEIDVESGCDIFTLQCFILLHNRYEVKDMSAMQQVLCTSGTLPKRALKTAYSIVKKVTSYELVPVEDEEDSLCKLLDQYLFRTLSGMDARNLTTDNLIDRFNGRLEKMSKKHWHESKQEIYATTFSDLDHPVSPDTGDQGQDLITVGQSEDSAVMDHS